jgi:hypothetical protein
MSSHDTAGFDWSEYPGPEGNRDEIVLEYGRSAEVWVYQNSEGHIRWIVAGGKLTPIQSRVQHKFQNLRIRIRQCLPESTSTLFKDRMAQALFHALQEDDQSDALSHFAEIETELQLEAQRFARYRYLAYGSLMAGGIICLGLTAAYAASEGFLNGAESVQTIALAAAAGAAGAWASILQRVWTLVLPANETPRHLMLQGATRIMVGSLFSVAALAAIKANLLLPAAAGTRWSLGLVTFVAGFSERLIPDLVSRLELQVAAKETEKKQEV